MKEILVISNDRIFLSNKIISSDYNDTLNIVESISHNFDINLISSNSKFKNNFSLRPKNKITRFLLKSLNELKKKKLKIFIISITPRNIFFYFLIKFFNKNINGYVYLRSNGHKEYKKKFGFLGFIFYDIMQKYLSKDLQIISVSKKIRSPKINYILRPSELSAIWFKKIKKVDINTPKLLYFGRFKKEKGVYSLINISKNLNFDYEITIAGDSNIVYQNNTKIKFLNEISQIDKIIKLYDAHNIFILPSFTEGAPKVILESLARKRPVIIFKDIKHVKLNLKGVFICERNPISLKKTIYFIIKNYKKIQLDMKNNNLPTKKDFQLKLAKILNEPNNK